MRFVAFNTAISKVAIGSYVTNALIVFVLQNLLCLNCFDELILVKSGVEIDRPGVTLAIFSFRSSHDKRVYAFNVFDPLDAEVISDFLRGISVV